MGQSLEAAVPLRTLKVVVEVEERCAGGRHALEVLEDLLPRLPHPVPRHPVPRLPHLRRDNAKLLVCLAAIPL